MHAIHYREPMDLMAELERYGLASA
jgi:hypothetical protein